MSVFKNSSPSTPSISSEPRSSGFKPTTSKRWFDFCPSQSDSANDESDVTVEHVDPVIEESQEEGAVEAAVETTSAFNNLVERTCNAVTKGFPLEPSTPNTINQMEVSEFLSMVTPNQMSLLSPESYLCNFTEDSMSPSSFFSSDTLFSELSNETFKRMVLTNVLVFPSNSLSLHKKLVDFCFYKLSVTGSRSFAESLGRYLAQNVIPIELSYRLFATILANWGLKELNHFKPIPPCPPGPLDNKPPLDEHNMLVIPFITSCADNFDLPHATALLTYLIKLIFDPNLLSHSVYVFKPISKLISILNRHGAEEEFFMSWNMNEIPPNNFFYLLGILEGCGTKTPNLLLKMGYKFLCNFFGQDYNQLAEVTVDSLCKTFILGHEQLFGGKLSVTCNLLFIYDYLVLMIPPAESDYKPMQGFMMGLRRLGTEYDYATASCYYKERVQHFVEFWQRRLLPFNQSVEFHFRVKLFNPSANYLEDGE